MSGGVYKGEGIFEIDETQDSKLPEVVNEPIPAEAVVEFNPVTGEVE